MSIPASEEQLRMAHLQILSGLRKMHADNVGLRRSRQAMLASRNLSEAKRKEYEAELAFTDVYEHELNRVTDVVDQLKREGSSRQTDEKIQVPSGQAFPAAH